ncbi:hypothetical protein PUN28_019040 [Cardiocondyla obscurior]|uniref:Glycine-rich protein n=1 Tax=Cardiocondyla obscurior TaxID=286306 RepID=A0AAW2ED46_9HYME
MVPIYFFQFLYRLTFRHSAVDNAANIIWPRTSSSSFLSGFLREFQPRSAKGRGEGGRRGEGEKWPRKGRGTRGEYGTRNGGKQGRDDAARGGGNAGDVGGRGGGGKGRGVTFPSFLVCALFFIRMLLNSCFTMNLEDSRSVRADGQF